MDIENIDLGRGNLRSKRTRLFQYVEKIMGEQAVWEQMQVKIGRIKQDRLKLSAPPSSL